MEVPVVSQPGLAGVIARRISGSCVGIAPQNIQYGAAAAVDRAGQVSPVPAINEL